MSSELDADLYGDLYGGDEDGFSTLVENGEPSQGEDSLPFEALPRVTLTPTVKALPPAPSQQVSSAVPNTSTKPPAIETYPVQTYEEYASSPTQSGSPTYTAPATQQVPTYQQPQSDYASDLGQHQGVGSYEGQQSHERGVAIGDESPQ
ncbi:hypothetical protein M405DRAFT_813808 [Rhizopogon salebrosus TDB-379]|nr:hypothetical protein M405DRAFT_813808 [Rhizopogon salebrosus TDB-379]